MSEDFETIRRLLRSALPPVGEAELERDLWPRMRRRLEAPVLRPSRLDWALAASLLAWFLAFPQALPSLLYHL